MKILFSLGSISILSLLVLSISFTAGAFAQLDDSYDELTFDYNNSKYLFQIMMNSALDSFFILANAPDSEYRKEIQTSDGREEIIQMSTEEIELFKLKEFRYILKQIDSSFIILSDTIPKHHEFQSLIDEAVILKNNHQFEDALGKYQKALDAYDEWFLLTQTSSPETGSIPEWIKNNAGWWADGAIDDDSFIQGIQFLIKEGVLKV
jgi:hypothetical protein